MRARANWPRACLSVCASFFFAKANKRRRLASSRCKRGSRAYMRLLTEDSSLQQPFCRETFFRLCISEQLDVSRSRVYELQPPRRILLPVRRNGRIPRWGHYLFGPSARVLPVIAETSTVPAQSLSLSLVLFLSPLSLEELSGLRALFLRAIGNFRSIVITWL